MAPRRSSSMPLKSQPSLRGQFRRRYDELDSRRAQLIARLGKFGENGRKHPGYKRAMRLLSDSYGKSKLPQRLALLQAAAWLIDVLERVTMMT